MFAMLAGTHKQTHTDAMDRRPIKCVCLPPTYLSIVLHIHSSSAIRRKVALVEQNHPYNLQPLLPRKAPISSSRGNGTGCIPSESPLGNLKPEPGGTECIFLPKTALPENYAPVNLIGSMERTGR